MEPNNLNEWWGGQPDGLKQAFSLFPDGRWKEADLYLRINIRNYCLLKKEGCFPKTRTARCSARLSVSLLIRSCAVQMERHSKTCAIRTGLFWKSTRNCSTGYTMNWK